MLVDGCSRADVQRGVDVEVEAVGGLMVLALVLWLLPGERVGSCHGHASSSELAG
jgi:hypothetical protein